MVNNMHINLVKWKNSVGKELFALSKKNSKKNTEPTIAAGMDDQEELAQSATDAEIAKDDYTRVVTLSYDEVDPS